MLYSQDEDNSDIWDDSALIKAYDNAVSIMKVLLLLSIENIK